MKKTMQVIGIVILSILMVACTVGQLAVSQSWKAKANEANLSLALVMQANEFLVQKVDNIIQRQSGQKTFGYPIDLPNDIKGHVILHYDEKANFNLDQEDFLIRAHWVGVKNMSMDHWNEMELKKSGEEK